MRNLSQKALKLRKNLSICTQWIVKFYDLNFTNFSISQQEFSRILKSLKKIFCYSHSSDGLSDLPITNGENVIMYTLNRKHWERSEKKKLIELWNKIDSVSLIALQLRRSTSSVRIQASRLGLRRRRRMSSQQLAIEWTEKNCKLLEKYIPLVTDDSGRIRIVELANLLNRNIDATIDKLKEKFGSERELFMNISVTGMEETGRSTMAKRRTRGNMQRQRICKTCSSKFWSKGLRNKICNRCRSANASGSSKW